MADQLLGKLEQVRIVGSLLTGDQAMGANAQRINATSSNSWGLERD